MAKNWYVLQVYAGGEARVKQLIFDRLDKEGLVDSIEEVLIPLEEVVELRRGKKVVVEKKYFPGYVFVKMDMTDEVWHVIKSIPKVSAFLGAGKVPCPLPESEVDQILKLMKEGGGKKISNARMHFSPGEQVAIVDGPFESFTGVVEFVDEGKMRLRVTVSIFGRATPVELEFSQVDKI